jgi:two-component system response regulator RegX3
MDGAPRALLAMTRPDRAGRHAQAFADLGMAPTLAFGAEQVLAFVDQQDFDVVVTELDLPGQRATRLLHSLRRRTDAALLIVGDRDLALAELAVAGVHGQVNSGAAADDVAARAAALLRLRPMNGSTHARVCWGPLELDPARRQATFAGSPFSPTPLQFRLLHALVHAQGAVVTKTQLERAVWGQSVPDDGERVVAHIRRIRARIEPDPARPQFLLTVRGQGFRLADA